MRTHAEERELIEKYREVAEKISARFGNTANPVSINKYGGVQITEAGAYVECHVWIPKEEL